MIRENIDSVPSSSEISSRSLEVRCSPLMHSARRFSDTSSEEKTTFRRKDNLFSQFNMLPERQSKINQIVSRMDGEESEVYCICRSTDSTSFMICCDHCEEWYHGSCIGVDRKSAKNIRNYYCEICRDKNPSLSIRYKTKTKKHESSDVERSKSKSSIKRKCGDCAACHRKQDCGRCANCKDMRKFGGTNKHGAKCRLRQCTNFMDMSRTVEPSIDYSDPKRLEQEEDPDPDYDEDEFLDFLSALPENRGKKFMRRNSSSSGGATKRKYTKPTEKEVKTHRKPYKKREKTVIEAHPAPARGRGRPRKDSFAILGEESRPIPRDARQREEPKQCLGPECLQVARVGSKYCSDACGMKLAKRRILEILPQRIQQWQTSPCQADETNKRELENIRSQQLDSRQKLGELDQRHRELDKLIERGKSVTALPSDEETEEEEETDSHVYCVTCGHEINQKFALRHMEKCFNKYESQTVFGSIYKTRIEGTSMFCDYYNAQQQTYCKRLKVLCPEHSKDPKIGPDEICGCPLVENVFEATGEFCRGLKRKCIKHHSWEKLRRAEIDMERVRQWMRLDELFEQERAIRMSMANRAGVLGLMLHQTIDHNPAQPMTHQHPTAAS